MHLYLAFLFRRDYFGRPDSSLSGSFAPQGLFRPSRFISIWLFCSTGIISAVLIHLYLALLFHRDYFNRPDSSLSGSFVPQGLFRPPGFISIWLFCPTGIISAVQIHLYLAFLFHRDYFGRLDSSLSGSSVPQRLFQPAEFISIWFFCSTEIISTARIHLYLALLPHRDYFGRSDASLSCSFVPQRLFRPIRCISAWLFCTTEVISAVQMHLYLALLFHRDYFDRLNASLSGFSVPQGLFRPPGFISIWLFCPTGIISAVQIHLYLAFLFHRDYFGRLDASLSGSFVPQRLFQPPGFISIWLFCSTGIISAVQIHLYLAFLVYN